tara:strand:- start:95 stop:889 length:795 start_codon:yes stop_codon:yes gene_type:complete
MNNQDRNWNRILTKFDRKCAFCGETNVNILQIDHKDPNTKKFEVKSRLTSSWIKLSEEVDKCQLLCKPCHDEKTRTIDKKIIQRKKEEFIVEEDTFLPLFNRVNRQIIIKTNKRDGKAWMKLLKHRSKMTGRSVDDLIYKDQVVLRALRFIYDYERMRKGVFPDKEFREGGADVLREVVDRMKKETPNVYNELYGNLNGYESYYFEDENVEDSKENKKQKPFSKVVDELIEENFKINFLCDSFIDEALKLYNIFYGDEVRFDEI